GWDENPDGAVDSGAAEGGLRPGAVAADIVEADAVHRAVRTDHGRGDQEIREKDAAGEPRGDAALGGDAWADRGDAGRHSRGEVRRRGALRAAEVSGDPDRKSVV